MLAYTIFGEAGGPGKTTLAASLAAAHARRGRDVLTIDLDPQDASLSHLLDVEENRDNPDVDHLVRHLIDQPQGPLLELVREADHGVDVIPGHNALSNLDDLVERRADMADDMGETFTPTTRLRAVLRAAHVPDHYDVLLCDPAATEGQGLYNAVAATGQFVIPAEATAKGRTSIDGLEQLAAGLEEELDVKLGVLAVIPNKVDARSSTQQRYKQAILDVGYPTPVSIPVRGALFDGAWEHQCSPYTFVAEHREQVAERERETLAALDQLAEHLETEGGL